MAAVTGERRGRPWTSCQSVAGLLCQLEKTKLPIESLNEGPGESKHTWKGKHSTHALGCLQPSADGGHETRHGQKLLDSHLCGL